MKRKELPFKYIFIASWVLLTILLAHRIYVLENTSKEYKNLINQNSDGYPLEEEYYEEPYEAPTDSPSPAPIPPKVNWSNYINKSFWKTFNNDYSEIDRDFRFVYPGVFTVNNVDSGSVHLEVNGVPFLQLESYISSEPGYSFLDNIKYYYEVYKNSYSKPLGYTKVKTVNTLELYKLEFHGLSGCAGGYYERDNWSCYYGKKGSNTFAIAQLLPVPDSILIPIIESVEFQK